MAELGHALSFPGGPLDEDNWRLRWPQSVGVFAKMGRESAQAKSVLRALTLPIRRATWRLDPNGAPDEIVAHVAEDLRLPVLGDDSNAPIAPRRGRVSWTSHIQKALLALQYGHMFFEQVYAEGPDGREHLVKLAPRLPGSISEIRVADDGGLDGIVQHSLGGGKKSPFIPVNRLVAYAYEDEDLSWRGSSVLRPAYKHWRLSDKLLRLEYAVLERNGMGLPVYTGSNLAKTPGSDLEAGRKVATDARAGSSSGIAVPAGADFKIAGVSGQLVSPREAIVYHDSMMAKSVLAHFLNLEGKGGSYALAETQSDLFIQSLQTTAEWVADVATQHIVEDLVAIAFPEHDGLCPRVTFDPIASKKELTAQALALLANAGIILADRDLEEDVRRRYSLPGKRPLEGPLPESGGTSAANGLDRAVELMRLGLAPEDAFHFVGLDPTQPVLGGVRG